jgi:hypothetical protein
MALTTAQLVAIVCHFNRCARGLHANRLFPSNSTVRFCEYIHFLQRPLRAFGIVDATPDEWLAREAQPGRRAVVSHQPVNAPNLSDRMLAAFVSGGGPWQLNVVSNGRISVREPRWRSVSAAAPAKKKRRFSAAQRAAATERMRLRWAAKRKAEAKAGKKAY